MRTRPAPEEEVRLKARARQLAARANGKTAAPPLGQFVIGRRAQFLFGIPVAALEEVRPTPWTRLPGASSTSPGVFHFRGRFVPMVDLAALVDGHGGLPDGAQVMTAVMVENGRLTGLGMDELLGVRVVLPEDVVESLAGEPFVQCITRDLVALLDVQRLGLSLQHSPHPP